MLIAVNHASDIFQHKHPTSGFAQLKAKHRLSRIDNNARDQHQAFFANCRVLKQCIIRAYRRGGGFFQCPEKRFCCSVCLVPLRVLLQVLPDKSKSSQFIFIQRQPLLDLIRITVLRLFLQLLQIPFLFPVILLRRRIKVLQVISPEDPCHMIFPDCLIKAYIKGDPAFPPAVFLFPDTHISLLSFSSKLPRPLHMIGRGHPVRKRSFKIKEHQSLRLFLLFKKGKRRNQCIAQLAAKLRLTCFFLLLRQPAHPHLVIPFALFYDPRTVFLLPADHQCRHMNAAASAHTSLGTVAAHTSLLPGLSQPDRGIPDLDSIVRTLFKILPSASGSPAAALRDLTLHLRRLRFFDQLF